MNHNIFNPATAKFQLVMFQLAKAYAAEAVKCPCHEGITFFSYLITVYLKKI
jgi:hypothetical protein